MTRGKTPMPFAAPRIVDHFNQQVLDCQDEAFTLALALLGDERQACEVVQKAILRAYSDWEKNGAAVALKVLQGVMQSCRQMQPADMRAEIEWIPGWNRLNSREQAALLLIDVLGRSYPEAAFLLDCRERKVSREVAGGRYKLAQYRGASKK